MGRQRSFVERQRQRAVVSLTALMLGGGGLVPQGARAQDSGGVRAALRSAHRLYDALEYERALEQLSAARR
ncbi:hypothetical protein, partial [Corallococcus sp. CA031C]|uniref:hypothetical protein n=1 Tax=Corallococcus sp. CA031C TaxID=2316725 RepID=UPI000EE79A55